MSKASRAAKDFLIRKAALDGQLGTIGQTLIKKPEKWFNNQELDPTKDRVVPGLRIRGDWRGPGSTPEFVLPRKKERSSINSVGDIWVPNYLRNRELYISGRSTAFSHWSATRMKCVVQFLSTPTADTPGTTLLLHFDNKRYLIGNVAEGTQRAAVQRKLGLVKVGDIFLTGKIDWASAGGVMGTVLTIADASNYSRETQRATRMEKEGKDQELEKHWLNIHGGKNLTHLLATARRFIFRKGLPIHTQEFRSGQDTPKPDWKPTWKDDMLKVWAMVIEPEEQTQTPRKRSHDDFESDSANGKKATQADEDVHDEMRRAVVADMFDSEWRLDALFKRKLSEVEGNPNIFIRNEQGKIEKYTRPMPEEGKEVPDIEVLVRNPWPGAMVTSLPPTTPSAASICYFIKNHPQRGKFDAKGAIALGVPPGPAFRQLTLGQSYTLKDGTVVTPDQVIAPGKEGGGFAIIELPNLSYLEPLLRRKEWSSQEVMSGIGVVIWILGPGVVQDSRLQDFMRNHDKLKHVVSSKEVCSNYLALESPASQAIRLHLLDPDRFPIPVHSNTVQGIPQKDAPYEIARIGKTFILEPRFEIQDDKIVHYLDTAKVVEEASPEVDALAVKAREEITTKEYLEKLEEHQKDIPSKDAEVITLGTGSALPSKYRNVSATLLRVPGFGNYLFDCGENTLGQLQRVFGSELPEVLRELKVIWISHLHADHHLGTASVIRAWNEYTRDDERTKANKLIVASEPEMQSWLREYAQVEDYGHSRVMPIPMGFQSGILEYYFDKEKEKSFGLSCIKACGVKHCNGAMAVVFQFPNGFKVAYSGDCRPSEKFARLGEGATLLIHEATFDDELKGDALAKKHSTTSEAIEVGRQMNARRILLTHFSQRYQKIPVMEERDGHDQVVIVAFDYMRVRIGDIAKVEAFKPALLKLYEEKDE
ncbi:tRNA 3 endonuclease 1 [Hyphodiscus hymeniophilus]|uniref:ribonuclease Z n=1 Tax=Hyphodiscus hymeniophilus TaxID=353542 RepID=A0A9P6VQN6_9HELO|nr:tRNA 3 endonuclease 1 [Hyphodiscus hymeniophilus]